LCGSPYGQAFNSLDCILWSTMVAGTSTGSFNSLDCILAREIEELLGVKVETFNSLDCILSYPLIVAVSWNCEGNTTFNSLDCIRIWILLLKAHCKYLFQFFRLYSLVSAVSSATQYLASFQFFRLYSKSESRSQETEKSRSYIAFNSLDCIHQLTLSRQTVMSTDSFQFFRLYSADQPNDRVEIELSFFQFFRLYSKSFQVNYESFTHVLLSIL
jgi:hypothetical protein